MNTRFNPTCNGHAPTGILHMGHIYLALVNEGVAHGSGGRFHLRFDDDQIGWLRDIGAQRMTDNAQVIRDELDWMGITYDTVTYQSMSNGVGVARIVREKFGCEQALEYPTVPVLVREDSPQYPFAPFLTAEVVIWDKLLGVDTVIVGDELLGRYALYQWMAQQLGYALPRHVYLPRLRDGGELDAISKTRGNWKLARFIREGWEADDVRALLARVCLRDPAAGWHWENVKPQPVITAKDAVP